MESISLATGSVGHLYKGVEMPANGQAKVQAGEIKQHLRDLVVMGKRLSS